MFRNKKKKDKIKRKEKNRINLLKKQINELKKQVDYYYKELETVLSKNETLHMEYEKSGKRYRELSDEYTKLSDKYKQKKEECDNKINKLRAEKQGSSDDINGLNNSISKLEEEKNDLAQMIRLKDDKIDLLNGQINRKQKDLEQTMERNKKNRDKDILKSKADVILKLCDPYENFARALSSMSSIENMDEKNKLVIEELDSIINLMKNNTESSDSEDDANENYSEEDLINKLDDILTYLKDISSYIEDNEIFKEGIILTNKSFSDVFESMGLVEIPTKGEKFNSDFHEPVEIRDSEDFENGYIIEELSKGYILNGAVIKRSTVVYCKKS